MSCLSYGNERVAGKLPERIAGFEPAGTIEVSLRFDDHRRHGDRNTVEAGPGVESTLVLSLSGAFSVDSATDRIRTCEFLTKQCPDSTVATCGRETDGATGYDSR